MKNIIHISILTAFTIVLLTLQGCGQEVADPSIPPESEGMMTEREQIQEMIKTIEADEIPPVRSSEVIESAPVTNLTIDGNPIRGSLQAPVTIVEFSDFECPLCSRFHNETGKKIKEAYVDTGKVQLIYKDFPLYNIHPYAMISAKAGECAYSQGKFWEMHDFLFENERAWQTADARNVLINAAGEFNLNKENFTACLDKEDTLRKIGEDFYEGQLFEVRGTPTFFINGKIVVGFKTFEEMSELIEAEL